MTAECNSSVQPLVQYILNDATMNPKNNKKSASEPTPSVSLFRLNTVFSTNIEIHQVSQLRLSPDPQVENHYLTTWKQFTSSAECVRDLNQFSRIVFCET